MSSIFRLVVAFATAAMLSTTSSTAQAASAVEIDRDVTRTLEDLYAADPGAADLGQRAVAVLVFPDIVKAGFIFGGAYGQGALRQKGQTLNYYNTTAASWGLQAGAQSYGYAMFFMNQDALDYLDASAGWEIGSGPSVVVLDEGFGKKFTSTTLTEDVYAIIFDQKGIMAGVGLEGSKITRINR